MNHFKRLIAATMAVAMIATTFVTGFATAVTTRAPAYTIQMVGNTLTLMKNGVAFMPYRLSTVAGADAVKVTQTATGEVRLSFVDSTGKARLIEIGKEANLEIKGTFPALVIDKSVTNTTVALAAYNKNDRNAIPTIIRDLQVNGAVTLQIPVGAEVQKATVSNKDTKVDIAKGSDVKNVTVAEGVVVGGAGSSDTNVSTDTNLGDGSTSGGSTSGGSTSGGSGSSGGSNSGDDESDNEPSVTMYTVTFKVKDSGDKVRVVGTANVAKGAKISANQIPNVTVPEGKMIVWYSGNDQWDFAKNTVTMKMELMGIEQDKITPPSTTARVTFNADGVISYKEVTKGESVPEPEAPKKDKHEFIGWIFTMDGKEMSWDFNSPVNNDITLVAKFRALSSDEVTVTFKTHDSITTETVKIGEKVASRTAPDYEGFRFDHWIVAGDTTNRWNFETVVNKDLVLHAAYVKTFTVTFKDSGVKDSGPDKDVVETVDEDTVVPADKIPTPSKKPDHTFEYWVLEDTDTPWDKTAVTKNLILTAKYKETVID